jgi:hypothetical protein
MEPLNLMVSLSHFGNEKSTLPPKQPKRRRATTEGNATESRNASTTRRAIRWLRTAGAR